ncbi:hypothetical protein JD844_011144 [Phrynosoma platyrhinos]|uniref:Uncharacterized protein n=1 Tax=Phrynosoma platyrhinos TaxID=52577 RepID=A0ABQ7TII5_PHRPL|nr:hypothetical protein JD844_011144 [Phrynosoma platyrhinos]
MTLFPLLHFHSVCFFCSLDWKDCDGREPRHRGQIEALERLLQQVRASHQSYSCRGKDKVSMCGQALFLLQIALENSPRSRKKDSSPATCKETPYRNSIATRCPVSN